jgi:hypothetical protein
MGHARTRCSSLPCTRSSREKEYDELGDRFEEQGHRNFGGFEKMVGRVADIEKEIGIYDLARFTPKV